jgi:2-oxoglutarate dehydrogenase E1 component
VIPASLQKSMTYRKASREDVAKPVETGISLKKIREIARQITTIPAGFTLNPKLVRLLDNRQKMVEGKGAVDWGFGELLALGSLAAEGRHIRFSGQDSKRGTFTSRHAVYFDFKTNETHEPMNTIDAKQGKVDMINSPLSEQGCLGFEFGYSVADPEGLVCWEAQFGDFANGAQIVVDQFLSASEAKWKQTSSLTLLLPHGHEGQGPEHSSARPERFLQLCGNLNMQVAIPTTPAQHFHLLRRQLHREFRKPLVVMTPKSLLRDPLCVSPVQEFESGRFHEVLDDQSVKNRAKVERVVACSGKIYYDLFKARAENEQYAGVALIRLEQLYPFPYDRVKEILEASYPKLTEIIWTQEEPQNMGGWNFVRGRMLEVLRPNQKLTYVGRKNSGTPAEGSGKAHEAEQKRIIQDSLGRASGVVSKATASTGK